MFSSKNLTVTNALGTELDVKCERNILYIIIFEETVLNWVTETKKKSPTTHLNGLLFFIVLSLRGYDQNENIEKPSPVGRNSFPFKWVRCGRCKIQSVVRIEFTHTPREVITQRVYSFGNIVVDSCLNSNLYGIYISGVKTRYYARSNELWSVTNFKKKKNKPFYAY